MTTADIETVVEWRGEAQTAEVADTRHFIRVSKPEALAATIEAFLAGGA